MGGYEGGRRKLEEIEEGGEGRTFEESALHA